MKIKEIANCLEVKKSGQFCKNFLLKTYRKAVQNILVYWFYPFLRIYT